MNKSKLKSYAPQARKDFIDAATARANPDKADVLWVDVIYIVCKFADAFADFHVY